jgi:uncharacterized protein (DUF2267 family)
LQRVTEQEKAVPNKSKKKSIKALLSILAVKIRVTRLDEFSLIGWLLTLGSLLKIQK